MWGKICLHHKFSSTISKMCLELSSSSLSTLGSQFERAKPSETYCLRPGTPLNVSGLGFCHDTCSNIPTNVIRKKRSRGCPGPKVLGGSNSSIARYGQLPTNPTRSNKSEYSSGWYRLGFDCTTNGNCFGVHHCFGTWYLKYNLYSYL